MDITSLDSQAFTFVIALAAVVNGLGIVRWLTAFSEYLRRKRSLNVRHYWVFSLFAGFQFLLHILMWWTFWSVREATNFNFLTYLYLLTGPLLLFLGTSLLTPNIESNGVDIRSHFSEVRGTYSTVLVMTWLWVIFAWPVLRGSLAPTAPIVTLFLAATVVLRTTTSHKVHSIVAVFNWLLLAAFIALYSMQLGGVAAQAT